MDQRLRLCKTDTEARADKRARESFVFPSVAASQLTRSAPSFTRLAPLPFPLSHPENGIASTDSLSHETLPMDDITSTDDLIRNMFGAIDRIQTGITAISDELDTYQFPVEVDDDDRPFAA